MPLRVSCPHCRTPCLVAEQHVGLLLRCGRCGLTFTTRADAALTGPPPRLDIGAAASPRRGSEPREDRFLVQHLVCCNLDERHELAALAVAEDGRALGAVAAALAPLLGNVLNDTAKVPACVAETIAPVCKSASAALALAVIWDGQVSLGSVGAGVVYHHSGGHLARVRPGSLKLAAGDWLLLACAAPLDEAAMQTEIAAACSSAVELAQRLGERSGSNSSVVAVHGY